MPVLYFPTLDRIFGVLAEDIFFHREMPSLLFASAADRLVFRCSGRNRNRYRNWFQPPYPVLDPSSGKNTRTDTVYSLDSACTGQFSGNGFRKRFPDSPGGLVSDNGSDDERHRQYSQFILRSRCHNGSQFTLCNLSCRHTGSHATHVHRSFQRNLCIHFITLVTAEMLGAKYGLGWYINWQKDMIGGPMLTSMPD